MDWKKLKQRIGRGQRGQSLVEFSLTAIILIMILSGLLDLGRLYFIYVALEDSVGEGALYLSLNPLCLTAADTDMSATPPVDCSDPNNAEWRVRSAVGGVLDWSTATITSSAPIPAAGQTVQVTIVYPYRMLTPIMAQITNQIDLTVVATQTIFNDPPA